MRHHVDARTSLPAALRNDPSPYVPLAPPPPPAPSSSRLASPRFDSIPRPPRISILPTSAASASITTITSTLHQRKRTAHPPFSLSSCVRNLVRVLLYTVFNCTFVCPHCPRRASQLPFSTSISSSPHTHSTPSHAPATRAPAPASASIFSLG